MATCTYNCNFAYGSSPVTIGEVTSISYSGLTRTELDTTSLTSASKTYIMGIVDGGTLDLSVNFTFAGHEDMVDAVNATTGCVSTPTAFILNFQAGGTFSGNCYIQAVSVDASSDAILTGSITVRITGAVTYAASV